MGDVVWTDEAREAALAANWPSYSDSTPEVREAMRASLAPVLEVLLEHVEAMVREARAEALREAADAIDLPGTDATGYYASDHESGYRLAELHVEDWLRARAEEVRRGE